MKKFPTQFAALAVAAQARLQIQATARAANPTLHPAASHHSTLFLSSTSYINQKITR